MVFVFIVFLVHAPTHAEHERTPVRGVLLCSTFTATRRTHKNTNANTNALVSLHVRHCLTLESSGAPHFDARRWGEAPPSLFPSVLTSEGRGDPPLPPPPLFPSVSTPEGWGNPPPPPPSISTSEGGGGTTSSFIPPHFDARSRDCHRYEKPAGKCHGLLRGIRKIQKKLSRLSWFRVQISLLSWLSCLFFT